jgi:hypothetical protein
MKRFITISTLILCLAVITGCSKNSTTNQYYVKATVNGTVFDAEGLSKAFMTTSTSGGLNYTYLAGKADNGQVIRLSLITTTGANLGLGTVSINSGVAAADYYPKGLDSSYTNAQSGTITITTLQPNIEGTFNFICADSTHVLGGTFSIKQL